MEISFTSHMIEWRGPAPYYFIPVPMEQSAQIKSIASAITYGWGVVYTHATIGETTWKTTLMPKDGLYLLPIRKEFRLNLKLEENQDIKVQLAFDLEPR
jgi:hypothetical protein